MTVIEKLDGFYDFSLETDIDASMRAELNGIFEKIIGTCDDFLTNARCEMSNERKNKFRRLRQLCCDECREIELGRDVLCTYHLIRELLEDQMSFVKRGCVDFAAVA